MNTPADSERPPNLGFELETITIPTQSIVPLKQLRPSTKKSQKFLQIAASIRAIGVVEPLVVCPIPRRKSCYCLLDGLLRLEVLKDMGVQDVECLISTDDESYTYNKRISRLSPVQEHKMIVRAMERGVPVEKLAEALNLEPTSIRRRFRLLDGICPEVVNMLSDKNCPMLTFEIIKKMKPLRQIEAADIMIGQYNFSSQFARALLHATPADQLIAQKPALEKKDAAREKIQRLERELSALQSRSMFVEETFGVDNLVLTVSRGYLSKLLAKPRIANWLKRNKPKYLAEFQKISEIESLPGTGIPAH